MIVNPVPEGTSEEPGIAWEEGSDGAGDTDRAGGICPTVRWPGHRSSPEGMGA